MKKYVILTLTIIFGLSILSGYMTYRKTNPQKQIIENNNPQNIVENVDNTSQESNFEEQINSELEINNNSQIQEENIEKTPVADNVPEVKQNKPSTPQVTVNQKQPIAEVQQESTQNVNNNNTPIQTKEETIPVQPEVPKQEVVKEQPVILGEEYKTNDAMINTIKSIINDNQSEDMKLYGYNIVVDSSIVDITSQFTYTKQRVIDKIKYKFGTIKIYVRDYYSNGQFICTQCYII